eukprot:5761679-Karenia_brevis.AAC.1
MWSRLRLQEVPKATQQGLARCTVNHSKRVAQMYRIAQQHFLSHRMQELDVCHASGWGRHEAHHPMQTALVGSARKPVVSD